ASFGVSLELLYSQKGAKVTEGDARATYQFNYLEFPVLARYQIPTTAAGTVEPHIAGGFVLGFEVGCKLKGESGGVTVTVGCDEAEVETKSLDLGFMFLGGFDILVGPGALMLDAAYNFGLKNINDVSGAGSVKNRMLYLRAGYKYPLGSRTLGAPDKRPACPRCGSELEIDGPIPSVGSEGPHFHVACVPCRRTAFITEVPGSRGR
ncbi:MAG: hypothetical protein AMS18_16495, partial [Gemmatimonas sp. SG8_17]